MDVNKTKYFSYKDQSNEPDAALVVEEGKILTQLHEAVRCRKGERSEEELAAAMGMMLMHHQTEHEPAISLQNNIQYQEQNLEITISNELDSALRQIFSENSKNENTKTSVLNRCKNILKEYFSRNSG